MVFIIIPVFNRVALTLKCLESVANQTYRNLKVVVVDDGSTDDTAAQIKLHFPDCTVISTGGDYYWTKSVNTGILSIQDEMKETDFVVHINNDTTFESSYIEDLLSFHEKHPNSIVGSLAFDPDSRQVSHLGVLYNAWFPTVKKNFKEEEIDLSRLKNTAYLKSDTIAARGLLIPGYVIKKVGLLDDINFPQYRSDEDYALTCRKAGINVYISTSCIVYNTRSNTGYDHTIHDVNIKKIYKSLFSILSTNNLSIRWKWAKKNSHIPPLYYSADVCILLLGFVKSIAYKKILNKKLN